MPFSKPMSKGLRDTNFKKEEYETAAGEKRVSLGGDDGRGGTLIFLVLHCFKQPNGCKCKWSVESGRPAKLLGMVQEQTSRHAPRNIGLLKFKTDHIEY